MRIASITFSSPLPVDVVTVSPSQIYPGNIYASSEQSEAIGVNISSSSHSPQTTSGRKCTPLGLGGCLALLAGVATIIYFATHPPGRKS